MYSYIEDFSDQEEDHDYQNDDEETYNWNHEEKECEEDDSEKNEGTYNLNDEEKEFYNNDEFEDARNLLDDLDISDKEEENKEVYVKYMISICTLVHGAGCAVGAEQLKLRFCVVKTEFFDILRKQKSITQDQSDVTFQ